MYVQSLNEAATLLPHRQHPVPTCNLNACLEAMERCNQIKHKLLYCGSTTHALLPSCPLPVSAPLGGGERAQRHSHSLHDVGMHVQSLNEAAAFLPHRQHPIPISHFSSRNLGQHAAVAGVAHDQLRAATARLAAGWQLCQEGLSLE